MKKVFIAFALGIITLLAPIACSKRTETVQPNESSKKNIRKDKNAPLTLSEQLAADADFQSSVLLFRTVSEQVNNTLINLTSTQRDALRASYNANTTEANMIYLLGINTNDYNNMNNYSKSAIDRVLGSSSLSGSEIEDIIEEAHEMSIPIEWRWLIHVAGCMIDYKNTHDAIGGRLSNRLISPSEANEAQLVNRNNFISCVFSLSWL